MRHCGPTRGFTLIEAMIALAILAIVLSIGMPRMNAWIYAGKVAAAGQFYAEGFTLARNQALTHNGASRLVLSKNAGNGQFDWRVDVCFPSPETPCNDSSSNWSTPLAAAGADPEGATVGFRSVVRVADALPPSGELAISTGAENARAVYFTPLGWVNPAIGPRLQRIDLQPTTKMAGQAPASALVLTLAGIATRCKPGVAVTDPQRCPP
ncbi:MULTISPECIES: Tfp pilus assembly protein FimT/FimU [unclassified Massilia]|uniref:pilus assembly FimT family protein n=1 Tax=unclassified Massilia TaxID=2609279 RepID=UPI001780E272|nr:MULTISPECIES: prepilin-type N-terminal cleavage/methylation domain-containing protein [unclassified Massilia]MBD8530164.1 prepilin-type N-terminal cleavage/methylation domain-containing protein [Massilia sp. CFBP 13647]MBD8674007.1 prepilin-type N-terminal cleavage/methylation domain-containing protein [Massilia sp. CFBP 13721]